MLFPSLVPILAAWREFGSPVAVGAGMSTFILQDSARLYPARLAWLERHLDADAERLLYERCWHALDTEAYEIEVERMNEATERARQKAEVERGAG